jgi:hypothetical protein
VNKWTDVVTDPLGLAGFALFLVFSLLALRRRGPQERWVVVSFVLLAAVGLVGGLSLAYVKQRRPEPNPPAAITQPLPSQGAQSPVAIPKSAGAREIRQETHGAQSPAISEVEGPVTIIQGGNPGDKNK